MIYLKHEGWWFAQSLQEYHTKSPFMKNMWSFNEFRIKLTQNKPSNIFCEGNFNLYDYMVILLFAKLKCCKIKQTLQTNKPWVLEVCLPVVSEHHFQWRGPLTSETGVRLRHHCWGTTWGATADLAHMLLWRIGSCYGYRRVPIATSVDRSGTKL